MPLRLPVSPQGGGAGSLLDRRMICKGCGGEARNRRPGAVGPSPTFCSDKSMKGHRIKRERKTVKCGGCDVEKNLTAASLRYWPDGWYCTPCRAKRRHPGVYDPRPCKYCGTMFVTTRRGPEAGTMKHCSRACADQTRTRSREKMVCETCRKTVTRCNRHGLRRERFCSRQCSNRGKAPRKRKPVNCVVSCGDCGAEKSLTTQTLRRWPDGWRCAPCSVKRRHPDRYVPRPCKHCATMFVSRLDGAKADKQKYCSIRCSAKAHTGIPHPSRQTIKTFQCAKCGKTIRRNKPNGKRRKRFCGRECAGQGVNVRPRHGRSTGLRRHVPFLGERDSWTCGICGKKISRKLLFPHPQSISIDHIQPQSKGGSHDTINLQLAHLECNVRTRDDTDGKQLRLIG